MVTVNKTKNAVIWGFSSESTAQCINILAEKKIIDIKAWIGDGPESTHNVISLFIGDFKKEKYYGESFEVYNEVFRDSIYNFMDMMSRHSFYEEKSVHDYVNIFNLLFDFFSNLLIKNHIEIVLFSNLPHEGPDLVLYSIAKKLNIKTILFHQSLFANKFFYLFDINDFGTFRQIKALNENPNLKIENKFEKNLFYMNNLKKHKYGVFSLQRNSFGSLFISLAMELSKKENYSRITKFLQKSVKQDSYQDTKSEIHKSNYSEGHNSASSIQNILLLLNDYVSRTKSISKRFLQRYSNYKVASKNFLDIVSKEIDLNQEFVYFPLHLQPELTTSTLGGLYVDQLLAIERLSKIVPPNWYIYVKENPKQTELMRGKWFFSRLRILDNVKVVPLDFNTYKLIDKCKFVATITGTAGWEAISGGKNTLVFGAAWYKTLPGVFSYENFNLEDILNYKIDHNTLENEFNLLLCKTGEGVIDDAYANLVENFDSKVNALEVATFMEKII